MPKILLASTPGKGSDGLAALFRDQTGREPLRAANGAKALDLARSDSPDLVVLAESLDDMSYSDAVKKLLEINAFINTAVVTAMDEEEFHEQSEGLGILSSIRPDPSPEEVQGLLAKLKMITG